jgi:hypothetical protein
MKGSKAAQFSHAKPGEVALACAGLLCGSPAAATNLSGGCTWQAAPSVPDDMLGQPRCCATLPSDIVARWAVHFTRNVLQTDEAGRGLLSSRQGVQVPAQVLASLSRLTRQGLGIQALCSG